VARRPEEVSREKKKTGRRRCREVLLPERSSKRKIVRKFVVKRRQIVPQYLPSSESRQKVSAYPYITVILVEKKTPGKKTKKTKAQFSRLLIF